VSRDYQHLTKDWDLFEGSYGEDERQKQREKDQERQLIERETRRLKEKEKLRKRIKVEREKERERERSTNRDLIDEAFEDIGEEELDVADFFSGII
jgi:molecular chaperone GrpE (heat shock protein)